MYLLDTDHISVFDRGGVSAQPLLAKIARINPNEVATTIVTYEVQWISKLLRSLFPIKQLCSPIT
jgi:tRNA(fMet)-specific endonuclease VapC